MVLTAEALERIVRDALAEDVGSGDVTTEATIPAGAVCAARILLKERGIVCGLAAAEIVFRVLDPEVRFTALAREGEVVDRPPAPLARLEGPARAVLTGERTALNLLGRLSGIATLTRRYVDAVADTGVAILDTRKTTPGLRALEKHAVVCGGGANHRFGLSDAVLIKDNHVRIAGGLREAVGRVRAATDLAVEVECDTAAQVEEALVAGAEAILLDNMSPATLAEAVRAVRGRARLEASGGVTLETVRAVAQTGVDCISVGALTHSARSLDISLEVL